MTNFRNGYILLVNGLLRWSYNNCSMGNSHARGNTLLSRSSHLNFYWELKPILPVYGTSFMVGVATEKCELSGEDQENHHNVPEGFEHLLGRDGQSWG